MQMILEPLKLVQSGINELREQLSPLRRELSDLQELEKRYEDLETRQAAFDASVQSVYDDPELSDEEKEAIIAELRNSPEQAQLTADREALEQEFELRGFETIEDLQAREAELEAQIAELDARLA